MEKLIENIRGALADDATPEHKAVAAAACRTLLAAFEAEPGASLAPTVVAPAPAPTSPLALLGKLSPDQALDLLIAKLRAAVPDQPKPDGVTEEQVRSWKKELPQGHEHRVRLRGRAATRARVEADRLKHGCGWLRRRSA